MSSHHFIIRCPVYESPTRYKTLEHAAKVLRGIQHCPEHHVVVEQEVVAGQWMDVEVHEINAREES